MKSVLRTMIVAGVMALALAFVGGEAQAEPMYSSYYGYELAGSLTASGVPFDPEGMTAAHKTLPLGTRLLVTYEGNSVEVVVNDRGPYVAGRDLDLSEGAAEAIGLTYAGSGVVDVQVIG